MNTQLNIALKDLKHALYVLERKVGDKVHSAQLKKLIKCIEDDYIDHPNRNNHCRYK